MFHEHGQQFILDPMILEKAKWERLLIFNKQRGFIILSSVFYGGPVNCWDYRPGGRI